MDPGDLGSLYQYFPTKEAMLVAVAEPHVDEMTALVTEELGAGLSLPLPELARSLVRAAVLVHARDPKLHEMLLHELPRQGGVDLARRAEHVLRVALLGTLSSREDVRQEHLELDVSIAITAVDAITHAAVLSDPSLLAQPHFEAEVARLVSGLLAR